MLIQNPAERKGIQQSFLIRTILLECEAEILLKIRTT